MHGAKTRFRNGSPRGSNRGMHLLEHLHTQSPICVRTHRRQAIAKTHLNSCAIAKGGRAPADAESS
eukprot:1142711-Pelagomonas_calceolata.AAC.5